MDRAHLIDHQVHLPLTFVAKIRVDAAVPNQAAVGRLGPGKLWVRVGVEFFLAQVDEVDVAHPGDVERMAAPVGELCRAAVGSGDDAVAAVHE